MKLDFEKIYLGIKSLTVYRNAAKDDCFAKLGFFLECCVKKCDRFEITDAYSEFVISLYEKGGDLGKYISDMLECDDNFYNYSS